MTEAFLNGIKRAAGAMDRQSGAVQHGTVESYNPDSYTAKVLLQPDGVLTGWLPIRCAWLGNGWGFVFGPMPGTQAVVEPVENDPASLEITGFVFSSQSTPAVRPPAVPAGEAWWVHQSGTFIKMVTGGGIQSNGPWSHVGNFAVTDGDVTADGTSLKNHLTSGVETGTEQSGPPVAGT